jgi:mono/diheme cytochrome c family protein
LNNNDELSIVNCELKPRNSTFKIHNSKFRRAARALTLALSIGAAGCTDLAGYDLDMLLGHVPFFSYMRWSVAPAPYEMPRLPADGSIPAVHPRGDVPPPFTQQDLVQGAAEVVGLQNPLQPTAAVLARGAHLYQQHCWACHGDQGVGDGPIVGPGRFPFAPPVTAQAVGHLSDGYLYGIIRVGRGLMPAYGDRAGHLDRWAMVLYMRQLGLAPGVTVPPAAPIAPAEAAPAETPPGAPPPEAAPQPPTTPPAAPAPPGTR